MQIEGYKDLSDNAVALYGLVGPKNYMKILESSLNYICIRAIYNGIDRNSLDFKMLGEEHTKSLIEQSLEFFIVQGTDDISNSIKLFEASDLEYFTHCFDEDKKAHKK